MTGYVRMMLVGGGVVLFLDVEALISSSLNPETERHSKCFTDGDT